MGRFIFVISRSYLWLTGIIVCTCFLLIGRDIYENVVSLGTFLLYISAIFFAVFILFNKKNFLRGIGLFGQTITRSDIYVILVLVGIQFAVLAYYSGFPYHYVQDEFIPAFTSYTLPHLQHLDWFAGYPLSKDMWVSQFPIVFFILQKPFFYVFGHTLEAIRISTWPYHICILIYLFLLAKLYYSRAHHACIAVLLYIFFAPNIYISSMGLHFVSSVFFS